MRDYKITRNKGEMYHAKVTKTILVEMNKNKFHWKGYGYVSITYDGPDGYSHFATHEEHPIEYALNRMKQDKYKEYN